MVHRGLGNRFELREITKFIVDRSHYLWLFVSSTKEHLMKGSLIRHIFIRKTHTHTVATRESRTQ